MNISTLITSADWAGIAAGVGVLVALVMQVVKPLVETIPVFDPLRPYGYRDEAHNAILRLIAGALTYGGVLLVAVQFQPLTSQLAVAVLGLAFPGSGAAFLSFKVGQVATRKINAPTTSQPAANSAAYPVFPADAQPA